MTREACHISCWPHPDSDKLQQLEDNSSPHPGPVDCGLSAAALVLVTVHMMSELEGEGGCDKMGRVYCDKLQSAALYTLHAKTAAPSPTPAPAGVKGRPAPPLARCRLCTLQSLQHWPPIGGGATSQTSRPLIGCGLV